MTASRNKLKKISRQRSFSLPDGPDAKVEKKWQAGRKPINIPALPISDTASDRGCLFSPRTVSSRSTESSWSDGIEDSHTSSDGYDRFIDSSPRAKTARSSRKRPSAVELTSPRIKSARSIPIRERKKQQRSSAENSRSTKSSSPRFLRLFGSKKSVSHSYKMDQLYFANNLPLSSETLEMLYSHMSSSIVAKKLTPGGSFLYTTTYNKKFELFYLGQGADGLYDIVMIDFSETLGQGANSVVFEAYNIRSGECFAAKAYFNNVSDEHYLKENRLLSVCGYLGTSMFSRLAEANAIKGFSRKKFSGKLSLMPQLGDCDLRDVLYDEAGVKKKLNPLQKLCLINAILEAVEEFHSHGLMHSDIKLDAFRVLRHDELKVFLIDFGSASFVSDTPSAVYRSSFGYAPPEVCLFENEKNVKSPYTKEADYFMLAVVLLELISSKDYQAFLSKALKQRKKQGEMSDLQPSEIKDFFADVFRYGQKSSLNKRLSQSQSLSEYVATYLNLSGCFSELVSGLLSVEPLSRPSSEGFLALRYKNQQVIEQFMQTQQRFATFFDVMAELNEAGVEAEPSFKKNSY